MQGIGLTHLEQTENLLRCYKIKQISVCLHCAVANQIVQCILFRKLSSLHPRFRCEVLSRASQWDLWKRHQLYCALRAAIGNQDGLTVAASPM